LGGDQAPTRPQLIDSNDQMLGEMSEEILEGILVR